MSGSRCIPLSRRVSQQQCVSPSVRGLNRLGDFRSRFGGYRIPPGVASNLAVRVSRLASQVHAAHRCHMSRFWTTQMLSHGNAVEASCAHMFCPVTACSRHVGSRSSWRAGRAGDRAGGALRHRLYLRSTRPCRSCRGHAARTAIAVGRPQEPELGHQTPHRDRSELRVACGARTR